MLSPLSGFSSLLLDLGFEGLPSLVSTLVSVGLAELLLLVTSSWTCLLSLFSLSGPAAEALVLSGDGAEEDEDEREECERDCEVDLARLLSGFDTSVVEISKG